MTLLEAPVYHSALNNVRIRPEQLGSPAFRDAYGVAYAYTSGSMYKGIASVEMVVAMASAGLLSFFGAGGLNTEEIARAIDRIRSKLKPRQAFGVNLLCNLNMPHKEEDVVDTLLNKKVTAVEASAFLRLTPSIVRYRLKGLHRDGQKIIMPHRIIAKISRPEVAQAFMSPAPKRIVDQLLQNGKITQEEAELSQLIPVASDICVESDSGGHTDQGVAFSLIPSVITLKNQLQAKHQYVQPVRVGAAGGIGTPESAAAAFMLGADFITTGSINQCSVEAGTSDAVKDILEGLEVQDTTYAPAGDMFEIGARVQVVKKGLLFAARANKLYDLYTHHESLQALDSKTLEQLETRYFKRSIKDIWEETQAYLEQLSPGASREVAEQPKKKMAQIFRWYFVHTSRLALQGDTTQTSDYQIHCGSALGAFNHWVKDTKLASWRHRHVADMAKKIMCDAAEVMTQRLLAIQQND